MGGIQVCLSDILCLKNLLFTLFHLQCLLSHLTMNEEIHLSFNLNFSLNLSSVHNNNNNQRPWQSISYLRKHSTVYEPGPGFPQPAPQRDPRFPQPSLRFPPVIPPVVPETTGFQGPFIPPQGFPQPQAFPQPITVTTLSPRMPPFLPDRPDHS
jgi:hypothetical protein